MVDEAGGDGDGTTIKKVLCGGFSKVSKGGIPQAPSKYFRSEFSTMAN